MATHWAHTTSADHSGEAGMSPAATTSQAKVGRLMSPGGFTCTLRTNLISVSPHPCFSLRRKQRPSALNEQVGT